jgi:hypothetical protein
MAKSDHYTQLAIRSIILGARVSDAAVICGKTPQQMRYALHSFCKQSNPQVYESMLIECQHGGANSIKTSDLRCRALDFISIKDIYPSFLIESLEETACVTSYIERCLHNATASLHLWRARRDAWNGLKGVVKYQ